MFQNKNGPKIFKLNKIKFRFLYSIKMIFFFSKDLCCWNAHFSCSKFEGHFPRARYYTRTYSLDYIHTPQYIYMTIFIIITLLFSGPSYGLDQLSLPGRYLRLLFISRDGRQTGRLNHILRKRQNVLYSIWYRQAWEIDHRIFDRIDRFLWSKDWFDL